MGYAGAWRKMIHEKTGSRKSHGTVPSTNYHTSYGYCRYKDIHICQYVLLLLSKRKHEIILIKTKTVF